MPSSVASLFAAAGAVPAGEVEWGERIRPQVADEVGTEVYVVAVTPDPHGRAENEEACPLDLAAVQRLLDERPELTLHGRRPDAETLGQRLAGFWCADEVVLYIGRAGARRRITVSPLSDRVHEYYETRLAARRPHAGGWPLKTLRILNELHVHYAYTADYEAEEEAMLDAFARAASEETRQALFDPLPSCRSPT
jgi:hypothetical protein